MTESWLCFLGDYQLGSHRLPLLLALFCCTAVLFKLTVLVIQRRKTFRQLEAFHGPPSHWLFGHIFEFKLDGKDLEKLQAWGPKYPYAFPLWAGPFVCFLNIHHPDYVKTILASNEPKDDVGYRFVQSWIGDGLLVSHGQKWFRHRRLITPGFHYNVLKPYVKLMANSATTMLNKWEKYAKTGETFEVFEHVSLMALDSILKCAFSCNSNCQTEGGKSTYIKAVYELSNIISLRFRFFPYHSEWLFNFSPHGYRYRKACRVAHSHTAVILRKRKEELKDEKELDLIKAKRNLDFLDILLCARDENNQGLSDEDIRAEVDTFMFEGHDSTSSAVSFLLYCLACHPEHQERCREEVNHALEGKDTIEWEDLHKFPYTTMCIKESLRLYPPIPGMARNTTKPMTFCDGRTLPAGCRIITNVYGIHRNPLVWENPDVFDPLRFLPENVSSRSPHAFVPFSAGPRNCIGQNFAMNELKAVIALTLKRYQLIEDPKWKPKLIPRILLRSLNGIHIKIKPVEPSVGTT